MDFKEVISVLWFFLPIGIANVTPIVVKKIPVIDALAFPLDFHYTVRGKRLLGDHKTIRGVVTGIIAAIGTVMLQKYFYIHLSAIYDFSTINYQLINPLVLGFLSAFGALGGDIIKSFFKRQFCIPSGTSWFPFDQLDYVIGGILCTGLYVHLRWLEYLFLVIIGFMISMASSYIGYLLKLKEAPI
ncbi:MAG TPA: CDP-archaeol synthase [Patescibacteria group bacterium]|nr:CDP-archaeol synthase [Patescibacteria group bacterium]